MKLKDVVGRRIKTDMRKAGISQTKLAEETGIDKGQLSAFFRGKKGLGPANSEVLYSALESYGIRTPAPPSHKKTAHIDRLWASLLEAYGRRIHDQYGTSAKEGKERIENTISKLAGRISGIAAIAYTDESRYTAFTQNLERVTVAWTQSSIRGEAAASLDDLLESIPHQSP